MDEQEFNALKEHENYPFPDKYTLVTLPVPIHRIPASSVDNALKKHMNISLKDLTHSTGENIIYLEQYDAFYNFTCDFAAGYFTCIRGELKGNFVRLFGNDSTLTLQKKDDRYIFVSHVKTE